MDYRSKIVRVLGECALVVLALGSAGCERGFGAEIQSRQPPDVVARGRAHYDASTHTFTWSSKNGSNALLDASNSLAGASPSNCAAATWNAGTRVLSVNARLFNGSAAARYLSPLELRLTVISPLGAVRAINTDLAFAGCGQSGLTSADDTNPADGGFDCILPNNSDTDDDPGWDFSAALGADNYLDPGEYTACRFIHFNLGAAASFTFDWDIVGVVGPGWPPVTPVNPVSTPTDLPTQVVSGRCVNTVTAPDSLTPVPPPTSNVVTLIGGAAPVTVDCTIGPNCVSIGAYPYCGSYSATVPLTANSSNTLEVYQFININNRAPSGYGTIVHDTLPPQVSGTTPANGAIGVLATASTVVNFSEAMDAASINSADASTANIFLREQGQSARIAATVTLSGNRIQAVLDPTAALGNDTIFELVVTEGVRDVVGNALASQVITTFTTTKAAGGDSIPPVVSSIAPGNGGTNVARSTAINIVFSEAIANAASSNPASPSCVDTATVTCTAIYVEDVARAMLVPVARTLSANATTVTLVVNDATYDSTGPNPATGTGCLTGQAPTAAYDFDCQSQYRVTVATAIVDLAGNAMANPFQSSFTTGTDPDATAPTVDSFSPPPSATDVSQAIAPSVLFSEPVNPSTVNGSSITLKKDGISAVSGIVTLSADGLLATLTPLALLELRARYVIFVNNTITDVGGNALAAPMNSDFTIELGLDTTPPTVLSSAPSDDAGNVSVNANVVVVFSEAMDAVSINGASFTVVRMKHDGVTPELSIAGQIDLSADGTTATFSPSAELKADRVHEVTVSTGVTDAVGNALQSPLVSHFTTEKRDQIPPCVVAVGPADGATDVSANGHFGLVFSESMQPASMVPGSFELRDSSGGLLATTVSQSTDLTQALVIPQSALAAGAVSLKITIGALDNSRNNNHLDQGSGAAGCLNAAGPSEPTFNFTVLGSGDTTQPTLLGISPANGTANVELTAELVLIFSEGMDPLSLNDNNVFLEDQSGNKVNLMRSFSNGTAVATLSPAALLAGQTTYRITVAASGPRDLAGNVLDPGAEAFFTTLDPNGDTQPPQVSSSCPADTATNVARNLQLGCNAAYPGKIVLVFDEAIDPSTVSAGNFRLLQGGANPKDVTQAVTLESDQMTVTITPVVNGGKLKAGTTYEIIIDPLVTDLVGNSLAIVDSCGLDTGEYCTYFITQ